MVHDTDIVELELRSKRFSLAVRKKEAIEAVEPQVIYQVRASLHSRCRRMSPYPDEHPTHNASAHIMLHCGILLC